jgi:hypothetical protein
MALVRATNRNRMIVGLKMVGRMRKAVFARRLRAPPTANPPIPVLRAPTTAFGTRESWLTWQMARAPSLIRMC